MPDTFRHPWIVVTVLAAGLAAWMGLGSLHDFQHADSLLTVLISTQRWTPFFWGQDRFGMLVPLVTAPIRHPLANLLAQGWIMATAALAAPFVVARFLTKDANRWIAIGALTNILLLLIATSAVQFDWLVTQPYALSIALGFAGLIVADDGRRPHQTMVALVLVTLASWVNIGVVVMLAIAAIISGTRRVRLLTLEAIATSASALAARYLASAHTVTALAPARIWVDGWRQLLAGTSGVTDAPAVAAAVAVAGVFALAWLWRREGLTPGRTTTAIVLMAAGMWLVVGTSLWVGMNRYAFRYMYPTLMIAGLGVSTAIAALFAARSRTFALASMLTLVVAVLVRYGAPSLARVDRSLDDRFGRQTGAVLTSGATVIAGDYWRVWPAVFHANLTLARTHASARVFGLSIRSEETDALWKVAGQPVLVAAWPDDRSVGPVADEHGVAVTFLKHLPEIDLYTGRP